MAFLSPLWLLGLLPWAGLCLYMMWGRRKRRLVPFAKLWQHLPHGPRVERRIIPPPLSVIFALIGLLLAVMAASGPMVRRPGVPEASVTIIVDRGITMSANAGGKPGFVAASRELHAELIKLYRQADVRLLFVPPLPDLPEGEQTNLASLIQQVERVKPTALDINAQLLPLVRSSASEATGPVIVVTDADLGLGSNPTEATRPIQVVPAAPASNVRIDTLAARQSPRPQIMVRVRNDSALARATLRVQPSTENSSGTIEKSVDLPPSGKTADFFFDVPQVGAVLSAELVADDDLVSDDKAWLVREGAWPRIEPAASVGELSRLIDLYRTLRPTSEASRRVTITRADEPLKAGVSSVAIPLSSARPGPTTRATRVAPHPITSAVQNWNSLDVPVSTTAQTPEGFEPILWAGETPIAAVQTMPVRQVWTAIHVNGWSNQPEYVIFWTAIFDWIGEGGVTYMTYDVSQWSNDWRPIGQSAAPEAASAPWRVPDASMLTPGLYVRADGALRGFNAPSVRRDAAVRSDWRAQLQEAGNPAAAPGSETGKRWRKLGSFLLLGSLGCLAGAAATWRRGAVSNALAANAGSRASSDFA